MSSDFAPPPGGLSDEEMDRYEALSSQASTGLSDTEMAEYEALSQRATASSASPPPPDGLTFPDEPPLPDRSAMFGPRRRGVEPPVPGRDYAPQPPMLMDVALGITRERPQYDTESASTFDPAAMPAWDRAKYVMREGSDMLMHEALPLVDPFALWQRATTEEGSPLKNELAGEVFTRGAEGLGTIIDQAGVQTIADIGTGVGLPEEDAQRLGQWGSLAAMMYGPKALGKTPIGEALRPGMRPPGPPRQAFGLPPEPVGPTPMDVATFAAREGATMPTVSGPKAYRPVVAGESLPGAGVAEVTGRAGSPEPALGFREKAPPEAAPMPTQTDLTSPRQTPFKAPEPEAPAPFARPEPEAAPAAEPMPPAPKPPAAETPGYKPVTDIAGMTADQLYEAARIEKARDQSAVVDVFGPEKAAEYERAQRLSNSTAMSPEARAAQKAADKMIAEMEANLTPEQQKRLFGIGEDGLSYDDLRHASREIAGVESADNVNDLAMRLRHDLSNLPHPGDQPTTRQMISLAKVRRAMDVANENGWDLNAASDMALRRAFEMYSDPADAAFMLDRFKAQKGASPEPPAPRAELPAPEPVVSEGMSQAPTARIEAAPEGATMTAGGGDAGLPPTEPPTPSPPPPPPFGTPKSRIMERVIRDRDLPKPSVAERTKAAFQGMHDYFERQAPLGRFEKAITGEISETGPRATAEARQGASRYQIERMWETGRYGGEKVFDTPPKRLLKDVYKAGDMDDLTAYALARRQQSKYGPNDFDMGISSEDAVAHIADIDANKPHVKAAAEAIDKAYHLLWDKAHEVGILPDKTWEASRNEFYVPVERYYGPDASGAGFKKQGTALSPMRPKRVKGGKQPIKEPIEQTFDRLARMETLIDRGAVGRKIMEWHDLDPAKAEPFMVEVKKGSKAKYDFDTLMDEAATEIRDADPSLTDAEVRSRARDAAFDRYADAYTGDHVVTHLPGGKKRVFRVVDESFADAIAAGGTEMAKSINRVIDSKLGKPFALATQLKRGGITLPLEFLLRQATLYDPLNTFLNDPGSVTTFPKRAVKGVKDAVVSSVNEWARRVLDSEGLLPESEYARIYDDVGPMHFASLDAEAQGGFTRPKPKTLMGKALKGTKKAGSAVLDTARLAQEAQQSVGRRSAAYAVLDEMKQSGEWKPGTPLTMDQATRLSNAALRSGGSFRLGGSTSSAINRILAFWKAGERIPIDMVNRMKANPRKYATRAFAVGVLPYLAEWMAYKDEDWYKDRPLWRRAQLSVSEDVSLPVAHPVALVGILAREALQRAYEGANPEGAMVIAKAFSEQASSWVGAFTESAVEMADSGDPKRAALAALGNVTPDLARGVAEVATDTNFFTMRGINPMGSEALKREAPELVTEDRINPSVNALSKAIYDISGGKLKITPLEIDHLARSYLGTAAKMGTRANVENPEKADMTGFGWMFRREGESKEVGDFYDLVREYEGKTSAFREYEKRGSGEGMKRTFTADKPGIFNDILRYMREINDQMRNAPPERKAELGEQRRKLARAGSAILRGIMQKGEGSEKTRAPFAR